jgi:sigma-E factor negative regulatory protein RseB
VVDAAAGERAGTVTLMMRGAARALLLLAVALPAAAKDGADWLQRMSAALATLDYHGDLVHVRDGHIDALRISHRVDADGSHERLLSLSGEPRELIRRGALAWLSRGQPEGSTAMRPSATVPIDPALLATSYQLALAGEDRIAMLPARVLDLRPRDGFRYGYRLWLERDSGLPLKSVAFGSDGRAVEQWMFTVIKIGASGASDAPGGTPPSAEPAAAPSGEQPPLDPSAARWQVHDVPRGYRLARLVTSSAAGEHQVYSDGFSRVSLFIEPLDDGGSNLSGLLRRGALSMFGRVVDGQQITVVGEVPPATVERIAQGVLARE